MAAGPRRHGISPSAPFSTALRANRSLITSWSVMPPQLCTASLQLFPRASDVMVIGTFHLAQVAISCSSRSFD
jgi:hypothetical protein